MQPRACSVRVTGPSAWSSRTRELSSCAVTPLGSSSMPRPWTAGRSWRMQAKANTWSRMPLIMYSACHSFCLAMQLRAWSAYSQPRPMMSKDCELPPPSPSALREYPVSDSRAAWRGPLRRTNRALLAEHARRGGRLDDCHAHGIDRASAPQGGAVRVRSKFSYGSAFRPAWAPHGNRRKSTRCVTSR